MKHKKKSKNTNASPKSEPVERFTAEDLDAISSDDDTGASSGKDEWNAEALALRQAINDGAFNHLLKKFRNESDKKANNKKEISSFIEADLDDSDDEDKTEGKNIDDNEAEADEEEEDDDVVEEGDSDDDEEEGDNDDDDEDDEVGDDDNDDNNNSEEEEDNRETKKSKPFETDIRDEGIDKENEDSEDDRSETNQDHTIRSKALTSIYNEISSNNMPWPETFVIQSKNASPFNGGEATVDIHDDLKREMTFYNMALDAVQEARTKCLQFKVPFSRPEDFFAEMVKSDDHMAKVKDRLIFETKKMDAVEQRKANKEQRLRSKEKNATRLVEKAQMRKEHAQAVEQWQSSSLANQGNPFDNKQVQTPNKKRIASDLKYGRGGKRGRFKQNDPRSKNDMSDYNPKGNFAGIGSKRSKRSTSNNGRPGKRARDAKRSSKT